MALVGNMIHDSAGGDPAIVNYTMFVAVFSMLSLIYLFAAELFDIVLIPMLPMLVDALNVLFFFVGAVALAAYLGAHSCNNSVSCDRMILVSKADVCLGLHEEQPCYEDLR